MAKPIRRYSIYSLRKNTHIHNIRKIRKGLIHVQATFINTVVTITDVRGRVIVLVWASDGACDDRGTEFVDGDYGASKHDLNDFQTENGDPETEIADAGASNADRSLKEESDQEPFELKKGFWRMIGIGSELQTLVSVLLSCLLCSVLGGFWKYMLWILVHATIYYVTQYVLPLVLIHSFVEAILESVKDFNFTFHSVSLRKRIKKFREIYSLLQLNSRTHRKCRVENEPPIRVRVRVFHYMRFTFIFLKEYKTYSPLFTKSKIAQSLLLFLACLYSFVLEERVALLSVSIKIPIVLISTISFYCHLHFRFKGRYF